MLESVLEPNAIVVPGYGTVTVFLDDGLSVSGTIMDEDDSTLTLKTATGTTQRIDLERIEERSEVTSAMPKMHENLTHQDIRDLLAYLRQLKGKE